MLFHEVVIQISIEVNTVFVVLTRYSQGCLLEQTLGCGYSKWQDPPIVVNHHEDEPEISMVVLAYGNKYNVEVKLRASIGELFKLSILLSWTR